MDNIVTVYMKHNDLAVITFQDTEHEGYLPYVGAFGGDDTELKIENETGRIIGWKPIKIVDGKFAEDK